MSVRRRLSDLETDQAARTPEPVRLVMSDDPPDEPMIPWTPGPGPAPRLLLVFAGIEYDPAQLGW